jgi:hypothetical protein
MDHLGSPPADEMFRAGHLSAVIGVRLADDREVVVKVRPDSPRMARAYDAKYQHAVGQPITSLSEDDARERLRRTGTGSRRS